MPETKTPENQPASESEIPPLSEKLGNAPREREKVVLPVRETKTPGGRYDPRDDKGVVTISSR